MQAANGSDSSNAAPSKEQQPQGHAAQQQWAAAAAAAQPQWMAAMQYPSAAAMVMMQQQQQQMMMYPHHYVPYNHPQYHQFQYAQYHHQHPHNQNLGQQHLQKHYHHHHHNHGGSNEEVKTVWVGDLAHWMDEDYLRTCFYGTGEVSSVKIIRNKQTGQSEGYGFVEFYSRAAAEKVLQTYNGCQMPNTDQLYRLNWASFSSGGDKRSESGSDLSIFVGDLAPDVTDTLLLETFGSRYQSVKGAKVVIDSNTGRSRGYGFVRFGDENERSRAMTEMIGVYCSNRPMRIGVATPKRAAAYQQQYSSQAVVLTGGHATNGTMVQGSQSDGESTNSTIFVGGLDSEVTDEDLRQPFSQFGDIISVKIPVGKGCGFVQFSSRKNAQEAIQRLNGTVIGKHTVRLSWGRSPASRQWRSDSSSHWNGGYNRGQYGNNGYAMLPNQDGSMYAAAAAVPGAS